MIKISQNFQRQLPYRNNLLVLKDKAIFIGQEIRRSKAFWKGSKAVTIPFPIQALPCCKIFIFLMKTLVWPKNFFRTIGSH